MQRTCSTSSTRPGQRGSRKGSSTRPAGYLVGTYATTKLVFDLHDDDVYWCTADIGWVTGHSYVVYGPLANGATVVMYEGAPDWPQQGSLLVDHRALRRHGVLHGADRDTRVHALGHGMACEARSVVAAAARIGRRTDQSRGVGVVLPHHRPRALPGGRHLVADGDRRDHDHAAARRDDAETGLGDAAVSRELQPRSGTSAATRSRWAAACWRSPARGRRCCAASTAIPIATSVSTWNKWGPSIYVTGDGAKRDADGFFWLLGRVDDVINVAGHRIGTMEVESALVDHPKVAEAAVVGRAHEIKGQAIAAFVTLKEGTGHSAELADDLKEHVVRKDRRDRQAGRHPVRGRPAENALGQDHAPPAARHRRRQGARRHDDARRSRCRREAQGAVRRRRLKWRNAMPIIETVDLWKTVRDGLGGDSRAARRVDFHRAGRIRRHHGALRVGQVDAHEPDRLPRHADARARTCSTASRSAR